MEPQIRNFAEIESFIKLDPQGADGAAREWTYLTQKHPEISTFQTPSQFAIWASDPRHKVDPNLWIGKEIRDAYFYLRQTHEEKQMQENGVVDHAGVPSGLLGLPFLAAAFLQRVKTFEEDPEFQKIVEKKKKEWLAKNPGKDTNSKEWIDYRYGSLENSKIETLYADAEKAFRNGEDLGEKATEKDKEMRNKKIASYDKERKKIYKNLNDDVVVVMEKWRIEYHSQALIAEQKKQNPKITKEETEKIVQQVRKHHWEKFAQKHPEKATAYAEKHDGIKETVVKVPVPQNPQIKPPSNIPSPAQPVPRQATFQQQPRPYTPPFTPSITKAPQSPQPTPHINCVSNFPQPSIQTRFPSRSSRFPGSIGRTTSAPQTNNALSNLGNKVAQQVGSKIMLLFANPVVLSVFFIFLFTVIIVVAIGPASTGEASPIETEGSTNITSCQFTRAGVSLSIKSTKLLSLFQEVSERSGVPASVLAGIAAHESQVFTFNALDSHDAFTNTGFTGIECQPHFPTSPTGALGFMQVQPPIRILPRARPDAYSEPGVRKGAELAGKTLESLTMQDFCDVRTSLYLGAGALLSKNGMTPPTTADQVEKAVCGYFGSCIYTSGNKSYNYGQEVAADFEKCQRSSNINLTSTTSTSSINVLTWVEKINSFLEEGPLGDFNKMITIITNNAYTATKRTGEFINTSDRGLYWCTNLVIDAYNLAGKTGLGINQQAVISMRNFWKTTPGYIHLDYLNGNHQSILSRVSPGYVVFFEQQPGVFTGNEHVSIVKTINIDSEGKGFLETYDANTNAKTQRYPIVNWDVKNQRYKLVAFGTSS